MKQVLSDVSGTPVGVGSSYVHIGYQTVDNSGVKQTMIFEDVLIGEAIPEINRILQIAGIVAVTANVVVANGA